MKRKEIYEHLANIYLDASSERKKKRRKYRLAIPKIFITGAILVGSILFFFVYSGHKRILGSRLALLLSFEPVKINFNFDPAKKEIYSVDLNKLNLSKFKTLAFTLKKTDYQDNLSLRIEFANIFKEKSEVYIKDIPHKWQDYKIGLSEFKNMSNWSQMLELSFVVEEWNAIEKKGVVYLDNIRFLR